MRPVYLLIEEVNRELLSRLLIGREAAARGHPVLIGQQWWMAANFKALPPGVVLFKGNNRIQAQFMREAKQAGHQVASIDEESFVSSSATEIAAQYHALAADHCDLFLAQGAFQRDAIAKRFPGRAERIVVTGNPRADLLRDPAFHPTDPRVEQFREQHGNYILINTNFTTINPKSGDVYGYFQICGRVGVLDDPNVKPFDRFMTWCKWERENLRAMMRVIRSLLARDPSRRIVLRPHPSERMEIWRQQADKLRGVDIIGDGDHLAWIRSADVLLHSGCSTGLEAYLLGSPAISLTPGDKWWKTPTISNIVNPVATDPDQAVALVEQHLAGKSLAGQRLAEGVNGAAAGPVEAQDVRHFLFDDPDHPSATLIADQLTRLSQATQDRPVGSSGKRLNATPTSKRIVGKAFIPLEEVRRRLAHVEATTGRAGSLEVSEVAPAVFQIGDASGAFAAVLS
ncbi:MAG: hypothetical protein O2985_01260 [Proteobacteria bacterium]|nr:hypothetical protein [Pseudomonadota bacterium]